MVSTLSLLLTAALAGLTSGAPQPNGFVRSRAAAAPSGNADSSFGFVAFNATAPSSAISEAMAGDDDTVGRRAVNPGWDYGSQKVRGVNLGGWLLTEPWITPSLYDNTGDNRVIDEWTFGQYVGDAGSRLENHYANFITADDFRQIKAAGLNHVRIPIGFWAFERNGGEPYYKGSQYAYLKRAVGWARDNGIKVMVDLHGVPGSQNGFDNSGRKGAIRWPNDPNNARRAKAVLTTVSKEFVKSEYGGAVTIVQAVNEPFTVGGPSNMQDYTKQYYRDAYGTIRYDAVQGQQSNLIVGLHDGFQGLAYWQGFMRPPQYEGVMMDTHIYTVFSDGENRQSKQSRFNQICSNRQKIRNSQPNLYTVVGEWSNAQTDCTKYLNGRGVGARYDGSYPGSSYVGSCNGKSGTGAGFSDSYKTFLRQMFETQVSVYEEGSGWFMWTWKTEASAEWDYQRGLQGGWITRNLNQLNNVQC